ncbi:MAG: hypothetical protein HZA89_01650 [Verrucomicrobia bacterium]|nr:hypothetical protein [Verrucomicrobiota bacterium]
MKNNRLLPLALGAVALGALLTALGPALVRAATAKPASAEALLKNAQRGNPKLQSIGTMSFGPGGLLLVAEPRHAALVAIATGDTGPVQKLKHRVDDVAGLAAARLGAPAGGVQIVDLAVNPASGKIYLGVVRQADKQIAILTIDADGKVAELPLNNATYVRAQMPATEKMKIGNITDVAFAGDRVLAAGASNEEFSSKIFSLPVPLAHGVAANIYSAETYHVAHGKWETKAPISSFVPYEEGGKHYVVGAFACTPIAKFPLHDLQSGANVKGTSVVELGSGNRPLDMFAYDKGGKKWLVTHTQRMGERAPFGPSKFWSARVSMDYLALNDADKINQKAARRDTAKKSGPDGIEIVDSLFGAVQVDKLNNDEAVVLRESGDKLVLEMAKLP